VLESAKSAKKAEISTLAGSLAYTTVFSIVPFLAILYVIFERLGGLKYALEKAQPILINMLAEGVGDTARHTLQRFVDNAHTSSVGWFGFAALLFTTTATYTKISESFRKIWQIQNKYPLFKRLVRLITLLILAPVLITASITLTTAVAAQVKFVPWSGQMAAFAITYILFVAFYLLVPNTKIPFGVLLRGAFLPAFFWELTKSGYTLYTTRVVQYANLYGSLAAIPLFLLWVYLAWYISLFGAVWIRVLQKSRK